MVQYPTQLQPSSKLTMPVNVLLITGNKFLTDINKPVRLLILKPENGQILVFQTTSNT